MKVIDNFFDEYRFLSNFSLHSFTDNNGLFWLTNEHYYQAHKTLDPEMFEKIRLCKTPNETKKLGKIVKLRSDFENIKLLIMWAGLNFKFDQNFDIKQKLIETKEYYLIEGNTWHDQTWGNCICEKHKDIKGKNYLGKLLMKLRNKYLQIIETKST